MAVTAWCVKIEYEVKALQDQMESKTEKRDEMMSRIWERIERDHDLNLQEQKDLEWMEKEIQYGRH